MGCPYLYPTRKPDQFDAELSFYQILGDDKKRATYDQYGAASQQQGFDPNAFGGRNPFGGSANANVFETIFGTHFGGGGRPRASQVARGEDL